MLWKGDRAVECAGLEIRYAARHRGFEPLPFRQFKKGYLLAFFFLPNCNFAVNFYTCKNNYSSNQIKRLTQIT